MPRNKNLKAVVGVLTGAAIAATAGTIYVLTTDDHKANDARKQFAEFVQKMKEWKDENKLGEKSYTSELFGKFSDEILEHEKILRDETIKDPKVILDALDQAKKSFEDHQNEYDDIEDANREAVKSIKAFNDLLDEYKAKNENNPIASEWVKKFEKDKNKLARQYQRADNKARLDEVTKKADELIKDLESTSRLADQVSKAKEVNSKLPYDFKNKENFEKANADAEAVLSNPLATREEKDKAASELEKINEEFSKALNAERDNLINQINDLINDAENYKNTILDYDKYRDLANKLGSEIDDLKSQMNNENEVKDLKDILEQANELKNNASVIKDAIDSLNEKLPNAEKALKEIESAQSLFSSSDIEEELKNAIDTAKETLKNLDKDDITSALSILNNKIEEANNLINEEKNKIIAETTDLITHAREESAKLENQEEYENQKEQLDDSIAKADKQNNNKTLLGTLVSNKNELESLLTDTRKEVAKDKLSREIAKAEKDLAFTKENSVIDPSTELENIIQKAKEKLENTDAEGKTVDQVVNEYAEAAKELKDKFLEKVKQSTDAKLSEAKELTTELEKDKYKVDGDYHVAKKDLDARIESTEATKDDESSTSSDVLERLNELNNATKEAKRYRDADEAERQRIIEEIKVLKQEIETKKDQLSEAKDGLQEENAEKYKTLIKELEKVLKDYEDQVKPNVGDYGVARLDDVKTNLENVIQSIPPKKAQIDQEFDQLTGELNALVEKANELVQQMPTTEYNPEKENLNALIEKNDVPTNKDSLDELRQLVKDFKKANKEAKNKIDSVNEPKDAEIEKIQNKVSEITEFINANKDEYPQITNPLVEALKIVKDDNAPSYANTQEELESKYSRISQALEDAKNQLNNTKNKEALTLSTKQLDAVKNSITSSDPEMATLKSQLEAEIEKARAIIQNDETDKFVSEKEVVDQLKNSANQKIADFEQRLKDAKNNFKTALENAKTTLETAKQADNAANYTDIISEIQAKIDANDTIDENGALESINNTTNNLSNITEYYNTEKAKADQITETALNELNNAIEDAKDTKDTMASEPDLNSAKERLEAAIESAKLAKDKSPKLTNDKIQEAENTLREAKKVAEQAIADSNNQKAQIKKSINEKEAEIRNYLDNELSDPEYANIKTDLDAYLTDYSTNDKTNLDTKTREKLEQLLNQMDAQLQSAKEKKAEKDAEIANRNKNALAKSKEALDTISTSLTSQDPEITELKNELDQAIAEANEILNSEHADQYVAAKDKLNKLKEKAEQKQQEFANKLETAKSNHADKLQKAKDKLAELKADPNAANLTDAISKLEQAIADNENVSDNDPISDIESKDSSLEAATQTAETEKTVASQKTDAALNKLGEKIDQAKQTKESMNSDPALNNAKSKLDQAIQAAEAAKNRTPKLTDEEIKNAEDAIVAAENEAKDAINALNSEKSNLRTDIQNKADEIQDYLNTLAKPEYDSFKQTLQDALNNYNATNKDNLNSKTKADLDQILSDLTKKLVDAKKAQAEKDAEIASDNRSKLEASKNAAKVLADSITSRDPQMTALKQKLNDAIASAENVLNNNTEAEYVSEKAKIDKVKSDSEAEKRTFDQQLETAKNNYDAKLTEAREKLNALTDDSNSPNYVDLLNDLRDIIGANNSINNNDPILDINDKTQNLNKAISAANSAKTAADTITNQKLADLQAQIDAANATKQSMNGETALSNDMATLASAITAAQNAHNHAPKKLTDAEIDQAKETLKRAENVAKQAIQRVEGEKTQLRADITSKETEIQNYLNGLTNPEYNDLKQTLQQALDQYKNNDKNNLNNKIKSELSDIFNTLSEALQNAKDAKTQKDNEIKANNKDALIAAKNSLKAKADNITNIDPKMLELKRQLNDKVAEAERIINDETANQYVSKTNELNTLSSQADQKIQEFQTEWTEANTAQREALRIANETSNGLNDRVYSSIKSTLDRVIDQNDEENTNLALETIRSKTTALNNAVKNANIDKAKQDAKAIVDTLLNLSAERRQAIKNAIDAVSNDQEEATAIADINNKALAARKENYNTFIDNIPYPSDQAHAAIVANTRQDIKTRLVNALTTTSSADDIRQLETKLNLLNEAVRDIPAKINILKDGATSNALSDRLTAELAATTDLNYEELKAKVDKYKRIFELINNNITRINRSGNSSPVAWLNQTDEEIYALKGTLKGKLWTLSEDQLDDFEALVRKDYETLNSLKSTFAGDILIAKNLINELKSKQTATEAETVRASIAPINGELRKFWRNDYLSGTTIRNNRNNYPQSETGLLKPYNKLLEDVLYASRTAEDVRNVNNITVPLYIKGIELNNKLKDNRVFPTSVMTDAVKNAIKAKFLEQTNLDQVNNVIKYVEQPNTEKTTGWYLEAYNTINGIGNATNKGELLNELRNVDSAPDRDVLLNIDTIKNKINEYKTAFDDVTTKLAEYAAHAEKNQDVYDALQTELNQSVTNKQTADALKAKIEAAIALAEKKTQLKQLLAEIPYPSQDASAKTRLTSEIEALSTMDLANAMNDKLTALKDAITAANTQITNLPYPSRTADAKNNISSELNGATSVEDVNRILPSSWSSDINEYKTMIEGLPAERRTGLRDWRLNKTFPTSNLNESSVAQLKHQILETYKSVITTNINGIRDMSNDEKAEFLTAINAITSNANDSITEQKQKIENVKNQYNLALAKKFRLKKEGAQAAFNSYNSNPNKDQSLIQGLQNRLNGLTDVSHTAAAITLKNDIDALIRNANNTNSTKNRLKELIDNIPYPNGAFLTRTNATKDTLKTNLVDNVINVNSTQAQINQAEATIRALDTKVQGLITKINSLPNGATKDRLLGELADADNTEIDTLETKVNRYVATLALIDNNFTHFVSTDSVNSDEHKQAVNDQIDNLKQALKDKLATVSDTDLSNLDNLINKNNETVTELKTQFAGSILLADNLIKELITKDNVTGVEEIKNRIPEIRAELTRFWEVGGTDIRNSNNNYPQRESGSLKPYDKLLNDEVRRVTTADQLRDINNNKVPLYLKGIDFNTKLNAIPENDMPSEVRQALSNKLLDQNTTQGMDRVIEYVAQPAGSPTRTTGWYVDALATLNTIGAQANRTTLLNELKNVHNSPRTDVLENIDAVRGKINEYKTSFTAASQKLDEYNGNANKIASVYTQLQSELNSVTTKALADALKTKIEQAIALADKKATLNNLLNEIPFPNRNNASAKTSLTNEINALTTIQSANDEETKLTQLKEAITNANTTVSSLPYPNGGTEAKRDINTALNGATSREQVNTILPSSWSSDITEYKTLINGLTASRQTNMNARVDKTYPTSNDAASSVAELRKQIIETYKVDIKAKIDAIRNITDQTKNPFKAEIDRVDSANVPTVEELKQRVETIKRQYDSALAEQFRILKAAAQSSFDSYDRNPNKDSSRIENLRQRLNALTTPGQHIDQAIQLKEEIDRLIAQADSANDNKNRLKQLIDAIPYPDGNLQNNSNQTKATLKTHLVDNVITANSSQQDITNAENTITQLHQKVVALKEKIASLPDGDTKNRLLRELSEADDTEINALETKINKYVEVKNLISNSITRVSKTTNDQTERAQIAEVDTQIYHLKDVLLAKLSTVADNQLENLKKLVQKDVETVNQLKSTFNGDILIVKNLVAELATKNTEAEALAVKNKIAGINTQLRRFWANDNSGTTIRINSNNYPQRNSGILKPFNKLRDEDVRSVTTEAQLRDINDRVVPLYLKGIEFNTKLNAINNTNMPSTVKDALKNKLLDQTDLAGMNRVINYVNQPSGSPVSTGWYVDALNTINNTGVSTNRTALLNELKGVATQPTSDVLTNIDRVRTKINEFKTAYDATSQKLSEYNGNQNKISSVYTTLHNELNSATTKEQLATVKTKIEQAIALANKKAELKTLLNSIPFPHSSNAPAKRELETNINNLTTMESATQMNSRLTSLKTAITEANRTVNALPYPGPQVPAKDSIKTELDNATTSERVGQILPSTWSADIRKYIEIIEGLSPEKRGLRDWRLNKTYPTSSSDESSIRALRYQIIETYKVDIKAKINSIRNISAETKAPYIRAIDDVNSTNVPSMQELESRVRTIKEQYTNALNAQFNHLKSEAQRALNSYNQNANKDSSQINSLTTRLNNLRTSDHINDAIQLKADIDRLIAAANAIGAKKTEIKADIDRIPYPDPNSREALAAKQELKRAVDSLTTMQALNTKATEISSLKTTMQAKRDAVNGNLGYTQANPAAVNTIKAKLNSAKSTAEANNILPSDWNSVITEYKEVINSYFPDDERKNNLKIRLNQTVPDTLSGNNLYKETDLRNEIITELKNQSKERIDTLHVLSAQDKSQIKNNITNHRNASSHNNIESVAQGINGIVNTATRRNYDTFINALSYPSTSDLVNNSNATKANIKAALTANLDYSGKNEVENALNTLAQKITTLNSEISGVKPAAKQTEFNTEFSRTDHTGIQALIDSVRRYKQDYNDKKAAAKAVIDQIADETEKARLQTRLDNEKNTPSNFETIKTDATRKRNEELDNARSAENSNIETIPYPNGTSSSAITALKAQVAQANTVAEINQLHTNNLAIKKAVESAVAEIDKLSNTNSKKQQLRNELSSTISIEGTNGINDIKQKAIDAYKAEVNAKKSPIRDEINRLDSKYKEKDSLLALLNSAKTNEDVESVRQKLALVVKRYETLERFIALPKIDLSGARNGLALKYKPGYSNDENVYALDRLEGLIRNAKTSSELDTLMNMVKKHENAIKEDLRKEPVTGNIPNENLSQFLTNDKSLLKTGLYRKVRGQDGTIYKQPSRYDDYTIINEQNRIGEKILNPVASYEEWKKIEKEAYDFINQYIDAEATARGDRSWVGPIVRRIQDQSVRKLPNADKYPPTDVPPALIKDATDYINNNASTRQQAIEKENNYIANEFFIARRNAQLTFDYNNLINNKVLPSYGSGAEIEKEYIQRNQNAYARTNSIEEKQRLGYELINLTDNNPFVVKEINTIFNIGILNWWVSNIVNSGMSQEDKYRWVERLALGTDSYIALMKLKKEFKDAGYGNLLNVNNPDKHWSGFPREFVKPEQEKYWDQVRHLNS